jgi:hypothetical protein
MLVNPVREYMINTFLRSSLKLFLLWVMVAVMAGPACAAGAPGTEEKTGFGDRVISSSIKLMAKTYVMTTDLEKLKRKHITQMRQMDDEEFYVRYANTLGVIDESAPLRKICGIGGNLDRAGWEKLVAGLDKNKLYKMIDAVPDEVIAARFRRFMARRMEAMKNMDLTKRIQYAWNSLVGRIEK